MNEESVKEHLHEKLRQVRAVLAWKLDGLSEYDIRRPLTATGTNLLGLVKHAAVWESRYLGEVFGRPFPEPAVPRWDDDAARKNEHWAAEHEGREQILGLYRRVWEHTDATINALPIDAPGHVPWWPRPEVKLFNVMVHVLGDTTRHAGHADILREQLDGAVGAYADNPPLHGQDRAFWQDRCAMIEQAAAKAAGRAQRAA